MAPSARPLPAPVAPGGTVGTARLLPTAHRGTALLLVLLVLGLLMAAGPAAAQSSQRSPLLQPLGPEDAEEAQGAEERPARAAEERRQASGHAPLCDLGTVVSLVGFDTRTGEALMSLSAAPDGSRPLVSWRLGDPSARLSIQPAGDRRFGGSVGPGQVFAVAPCGTDGCLQPMLWQPEAGERLRGGRRAATWVPLGEPLTAPLRATAHTSWDLDGHPWLVFHTPGDRLHSRRASAYRLEGREWRFQGSLEVTALGVPAVQPAPWMDRSVVTGNGLFSADGEPRRWIASLPAPGGDGEGQLFALTGREAAYLSSSGLIYRSERDEDGGDRWRRSVWTPWATGTAEPWQRGVDYQVDIPLGRVDGELPVLWIDRRLRDREETLLWTEMTARGEWRRIAEGPAQVPTSSGDALGVGAVVRSDDGRWAAIFGCIEQGGEPRLVIRERSEGRVGPPRLVPIR